MDVAVAMGCGSIGDVEHRAIAGIVGGQRVGHEVSFNVIANGLRSLRTATMQSSDTARSGGALDCFAPLAMTHRDRKSVVSGKSVSVRVDLGSRRIIKKKTQYKNMQRQLTLTK